MIPPELRALPQWVAWRIEARPDKPKPTKIPVNPHTGWLASTTDPATWGTYRQALAALDADGIGFVFSDTDPYVGVDLDDCLSDTGSLHPAAWEIVRSLDGYTEFSPSGRGLHIVIRGHVPRGRRTKKTPWCGELEIYGASRFFTIGDGGRGTIREAQDELTALIAYYFPEPEEHASPRTPRPVAASDTQIVERILTHPRVAALWRGDMSEHNGDHSAADLALCCHLAYFTGSDPVRMDALFRASALMRPKWDERRGEETYGAMTIRRALGN